MFRIIKNIISLYDVGSHDIISDITILVSFLRFSFVVIGICSYFLFFKKK
jgi:hypothetical protein